MNFETSKTLGGIGAILMLISVFLSPLGQGFAGLGLGIVGLIMVLISMYGFANYYKERTIFNNALLGVIALIVGVVIAVSVLIFAVFAQIVPFLQTVFPGWNGTDWSAIQGMTPDTSNIDISMIIPFLTSFILFFVVIWVFAIIATFFIRRSLRELSIRSGTGLFSTAGLLLLIGAVLIILFGLGLILVWIATLLLVIAFFTMRHQEPAPPPSVSMAPPAPPAPTSV